MTNPSNSYQPVIIIGAPRSGTNILRDTLARLPGAGTWPCDEINYIWRHGNVRFPSDAFPPALARPSTRRYVRARFDRLAHRRGLRYVVEKTCANSLRIGFVDAVIERAKYLFIVRNGLDAVPSAVRRWKASLDFVYVMQKARFVPPTDVPYYATRYLMNRVYRHLSTERRLAFWGPRLDEMSRLLRERPVDEVAAIQWLQCVDAAERGLGALGPGRVLKIRYEEFVTRPEHELEKVRQFLGMDSTTRIIKEMVRDVSGRHVGKGSRMLDEASRKRLSAIMESTLRRHGYL
jgi:hypothetical protein